MGLHPTNMVRSGLLGDALARYEAYEDAEVWLGNFCDLTSTGGYGSDDSVGPELVDAGIGIGVAAARLGPDGKVFFALCEGQAYYLVGVGEAETVARFTAGVDAHIAKNGIGLAD